MNDELLTYYDRELAYLRQAGAKFAEEHPKIAGRLKMDADSIEDPHVSRLLEGVAFLTAKIRHKLDDCFPELTDALLNTIYPDYQAPIPSYSILQLKPKSNLEDGFKLNRGKELENVNPYDYSCSFRTCYDLNVWPYTIENASLVSSPFDAPEFEFSSSAKSVIKIELQCCPWVDSFEELAPTDFDCFLSGSGNLPFKLYEMIFNNTVGIALVDPANYSTATSISIDSIKAKGFDNEESVLPYTARAFNGNRLLAEYFTMPEKYLFFKLDDLAQSWQGFGQKATLYFYLDCTDEELERHVSAQHFSYACTPVVNLFETRADPIHLEEYQQEVQVHPFIGETERAEVHSITSVFLVTPDGDELEVKPFYRTMHPRNTDESALYWHARREMTDWNGIGALEGFETYVSIVNAHFKEHEFEQGWILNIDTLCTNRNQPASLPFGPDEPKMNLLDSCSELLAAECKTPMSKPLRVSLHEKTRWQLVSHLTLQHFSDEDGLDVLRKTLILYDFKAAPDTSNFIDGILSLNVELKSSRLMIEGVRAVAMGNLITIEFRESQFSGNGVFVFAKVLECYFAQFAAINSFVQLQINIHGRVAPLYVGKPMSGNRTLI